jgi:hypothetical protein
MAQVEYLVVGGGGGGGGGFQGGGGGAGGFLTATGLTVTAKNYTITVGLGGKGCRNGDSTAALNGGNSEILDGVTTLVSSIGGGRGGSEAPDATASTGGCGGGGNRASGASGTLGQGNAGGNGATSSQWPCGGGGGASGVGGNGSSPTTRGTGGPGTSSSISGASVTYSTGGLGGWRPFNTGEQFTGTTGGNNTGDGGGGGGGRNLSANPAGVGGNGGSGVVIIRYTTDGSDGVDATLTTGGTKTTSGIYTIHTFTTGGTFSVVTVTVTTTSNVIKSATTVSIGTLKKNDFLIGVSTSVDYGPTVTTGFWNGISPPSNGYTVYAQKSSQGPSIRLASNDSELITIATQYGGTGINTIYDALNYFNDNSTYMVTNINYPDIVTSGLTAMWDGGFVPSYPRTGTTWSDLSGNEYDLALLGGPVYSGTNGGGVYFDGVNDTAQSTSITLSYPQGYSLSMWFEISSIETNGGLFSFNGSNFINLTFTTSSFGWETGLSERLDWNVAPVVGQIYNITCTYNPNTSTSIIYENGTQVAINTSSTVQHTSQTAQLKLDNSPSLNLFNGAIYNCFFYTNKVLSPAEVTQNYNALKGRFGL